MSLQTGARVGPYEISGKLGAGGMGEVYRARDTRLDRSVAIKVLSTDFAGHADLRARFEREARTISKLNHPNICTLHDIGNEDGTEYLVMELLDGETLADRVAKGPLPLTDVCRYGAQIADALAAAHRQNITHRDLKPANVMLTKAGAKLLDFGLAKTVAAAAAPISSEDPTRQMPLTQEGAVLGTFQYMAPEQLSGEEADARTDIFALGAVLYEMSTGARAFTGKNRTSLIANILSVNPRPIGELQPLTPPALSRLIQRCLAKDPEERWQSAADVAEELRWIAGMGMTEAATTSASARAPRRERVAWLIAGLATAIAVGLFTRLLQSQGNVAPLYYGSINPPARSRFWFEGPHAGALTISPDSRYLTFVAPGPDSVSSIWVRDLRSRNQRALSGTQGAEYPFWSPDSRQLGFFQNRKLKTISVDGGASVDVCDVKEPRGGSWSREGVILMTPYWRDPIYRVAATGGKAVPVTKLDPGRNETTHRWPFFLPDGKHFLYFAGSHTSEVTSGDNAIYVASIEGGPSRLILRARSNVIYAAGHLLFVRERNLVAQRFDNSSYELEGEPVTLAADVLYEKGFFQAVFGASDRVLAFTSGLEIQSRVSWLNRKGETIGALSDPGLYFGASLAPNGKLAAVAFGDPSDIWLFDLERGIRSRFTFDPWTEAEPRWSPDSKTLLYWSDRNVQVDTMKKLLGAAAGETTFLGDPKSHEKPLDWSRDGGFILVARGSTEGAENDLWIYPADSTAKPFRYISTPFDEWDARFSPDGKWVAYVSDEAGREEVYVAPFPEASDKIQISTNGGSLPRWRADGRELFFLARDGAMMSIPIVSSSPFTAGPATVLFRVPMVFAPDPAYYDVTADGQRFLVTQPEERDEEPVTLIINWTSLLKQK